MELCRQSASVVFTRKAQCRDCHRCLRECPVKAISVHDGQAAVVPEQCVACGTCIRTCPQHAKAYRNDVVRVEELLSSNVPVAVSLAPAYAAQFTVSERLRLASALRQLGFCYVAETAEAAPMVAAEAMRLLAEPHQGASLWTSCAAVVSYVERYRPELLSALVPVASPMVAHARLLKSRLGAGTRVVFVGPCVAKKLEAERPENAGAVDVVWTFEELLEAFTHHGISLTHCEESRFDAVAPWEAKSYALPSGSLRLAGLNTDNLALHTLSVSGFEEIDKTLADVETTTAPLVVEPLFCRGGCVAGPGMATDRGWVARRLALLEPRAVGERAAVELPRVELRATFAPAALRRVPPIDDAQVEAMLVATGKAQPEDQLNCGACGYGSCRDKARAVVRGLAEPEMCVPRMRRLAEQRTDRIIETSPNGIVVLDEHLNVLNMNPAFRRLFMSSDGTLGRHISVLMDPEPFQRLLVSGVPQLDVTVKHERYGLVCRQILYRLPETQQFVGIFVNVSHDFDEHTKIERLRDETVQQARELLAHQIEMAQHITEFLGQSTAKGEVLVQNLVKVAGREPETDTQPLARWLWNTYTSK